MQNQETMIEEQQQQQPQTTYASTTTTTTPNTILYRPFEQQTQNDTENAQQMPHSSTAMQEEEQQGDLENNNNNNNNNDNNDNNNETTLTEQQQQQQQQAFHIVEHQLGLEFSRIILKQGQSLENLEDLMCGICHEIAIDPYQCDSCKKLYCFACLDFWRQVRDSCPLNCKMLSFQPANQEVIETLNNLEFTCSNHDLGCKEIITVGNVHEHEPQCEFQQVICDNLGCCTQVCKKDIEGHQEKCDFMLISCENCNNDITKRDREDHNCLVLMNDKVKFLEEKVGSMLTREQVAVMLEDQKKSYEEKINELMNKVTALANNQITQKNFCSQGHYLNYRPLVNIHNNLDNNNDNNDNNQNQNMNQNQNQSQNQNQIQGQDQVQSQGQHQNSNSNINQNGTTSTANNTRNIHEENHEMNIRINNREILNQFNSSQQLHSDDEDQRSDGIEEHLENVANGFTCGDCKSQTYQDLNESTCIGSYRCEVCDFDRCEKCFSANRIA